MNTVADYNAISRSYDLIDKKMSEQSKKTNKIIEIINKGQGDDDTKVKLLEYKILEARYVRDVQEINLCFTIKQKEEDIDKTGRNLEIDKNIELNEYDMQKMVCIQLNDIEEIRSIDFNEFDGVCKQLIDEIAKENDGKQYGEYEEKIVKILLEWKRCNPEKMTLRYLRAMFKENKFKISKVTGLVCEFMMKWSMMTYSMEGFMYRYPEIIDFTVPEDGKIVDIYSIIMYFCNEFVKNGKELLHTTNKSDVQKQNDEKFFFESKDMLLSFGRALR